MRGRNRRVHRRHGFEVVEIDDMRFVNAHKSSVIEYFFVLFEGFGNHYFFAFLGYKHRVIAIRLEVHNIFDLYNRQAALVRQRQARNRFGRVLQVADSVLQGSLIDLSVGIGVGLQTLQLMVKFAKTEA